MAKKPEVEELLPEDDAEPESAEDEAAAEAEKAEAKLAVQSTFLGREFLTWLLHRSSGADPLAKLEKEDVTVLCLGPIALSGVAKDTSDLVAKGVAAPYAPVVRQAVAAGLLVQSMRLRITIGEKLFEAVIEAEHLSLRAIKLPGLLAEDDDDKLGERLWLLERLGQAVDALYAAFVALRTTPDWDRYEVPRLRRWLERAE